MAGDVNDPVNPSRGAWERVSAGVREAEAHRGRFAFETDEQQGSMPGITVEVTGLPVLVTTTTTTTTTDPGRPTSTTLTSTTTTCFGNSTTTPAPNTTYLYPGRFLYRNIDALTKEEHYFPGENCWINETQGEPLGIGCRFPGQMAGQYLGYTVISVRGKGNSLSCTVTTTTTTCACVGTCIWQLAGTAPNQYWALIEDCNGQTVNTTTTSTTTTSGTGTGTTTSSTTTSTTTGTGSTTPLPCGCPHPTWCPVDSGGCAHPLTFTQCERGIGYPLPGDVYFCSTTTSTTTVTRDPLSCGTGCSYKFVGHGIPPIVLVQDCFVGVLDNGQVCLGCPGPRDGAPCTVVNFPCTVPPPIPYCGGSCGWLWPDVPGVGWIRLPDDGQQYTGCRFGCGPGCTIGCNCSPPQHPGSACGQLVTTYCQCRGCPPGSSTGTNTTTTNIASCIGRCQLQWDGGLERWVIVSGCGPSCDCERPLVNGDDNCMFVETPCQTTTTTGTTNTTTTSTTTTTTVTTCPPVGFFACSFRCDDLGGGTYAWTLCRDRCDHGGDPPCVCCPATINPPGTLCGSFGIACPPCTFGNVGDYCGRNCNCGTPSTTTTTTTTTSPGTCDDCTASCCYICGTAGTGPLDLPAYEWHLCQNLCGTGCDCPPSDSACPVCDAGHLGDLCQLPCDCGMPGFTGAYFDNPGNSGYAGSLF